MQAPRPPPHIKAAPNLIIFIATAFNKVGFKNAITGWSEKAKLLGIRDYYNVIIWNRDMPRWRIDRLRRQILYYHERGAIAISAEAGNQWASEGLNYYVAAKLMWDVNADVDTILDDFFTKCWGNAAAPMRRYYERFKRGGHMSSRMLKFCLQDLREGSELAKRPEVIKRLDHMKLYLHWVRLYLEHNTAPAGEPSVAAARKALHFAWRIRKTNMVHSYAQFRERRIWRISRGTSVKELNRWKLTDKPLDIPDQPETNLVSSADARRGDVSGAEQGGDDEVDALVFQKKKEPTEPPPMFTHDEIEALFKEDIEVYGTPVNVPAKTYSPDLVPVALDTPGLVVRKKAAGPLYRGENSFLVYSRKGDNIHVKVRPGFVSPKVGLCRVANVKTPGKTLVELKIEGTDPRCLSVRVPSPGLYRFSFALGGMAARIDFGRLPAVWELIPGGAAHVIGLTGRLFFFVPKGTKAFAVGLKTPDGFGKVFIHGPDGEVVLHKVGNFAPGEEFVVKVPKGRDGAIWSFQVRRCEDVDGIYLLGIPPYATTRPPSLLIPK